MLFALSYDYVGDLSETVGADVAGARQRKRRCARRRRSRRCPRSSPPWPRSARPSCRRSSPHGSTGSTRPAAGRCSSSSPARCASACRRGSPRPRSRRIGDKDADEVELVWPTLTPPYADLFAWVEGRAERPASGDPAPFRPPMLSHAIEDSDFAALDPADFVGGVEMGRHPRAGGRRAGLPTAAGSRGCIRAPARTSRRAFPISPRRSISTARSTASS